MERGRYTVWSSEDDDFELMDAFKGERREGAARSSVIWLSVRWAVLSIHPQAEAQSPEIPRLVLANGSLNPLLPETYSFCRSDTIAGILMRRFGGFAVLTPDDFKSP